MLLLQLLLQIHSTWAMEEAERSELRLEASDMFYHAYNAYMERAWPADELMPLSCRGRYRGREPSRGDIDEALGNFSLTLIDSLDMLVVLGDIKEFEAAVEKVVNTVSFDTDVVVSVFETNIRIVGGLVSAHILAELVREREGVLEWYRGQLLNMAVDVANRLLPAFNSTTGLPYPRVNLRTGLEGVNTIQLTCTACAGSMILEFAALSRLSGEKIFEEKASRAMDVLWAARHRQSNLVGNVLNVNTGDWVRRDSGVGAGIDSYYEYVAKAYVLLGEEKYLERWNTHYSAVMKYLGSGPLMMDVHMHRPTTNSKHFADALGAFWPGLQVLMGDLKPAIEQHEVLYQITKRHHFLPEAVTSDFQVHWGQHLLRPEFVESTYFLYKATRDPHYLEVGKKVLKALQKHARVTCGYAAVKDVRTLQHEDRMDSFVLSETLKYLYLLFAKPEDLYLDIEQFVFTTEAHLLPLSLARLSNTTAVPLREEQEEVEDEEVEFAQACPSTRYMFPGHDSAAKAAASVRQPLGNIVEDSCPKQKVINRRLLAAEFQSGNPQHIQLLKDMGISIVTMADGRVQLLHTFASAASQEDAEEGLYFMQDMIDLSKQQTSLVDSPPKQVGFVGQDGKEKLLQAGPAQFGPELKNGFKVKGKLMVARDRKSCEGSNSQEDKDSLIGNIVLVERGDCMFIEKGRVLQGLGARGGIVIDTAVGSAAATSPLFAMSGDGSNDVNIPMVFLFHAEATLLLEALKADPQLEVSLEEKPEISSTGYCMQPNRLKQPTPKSMGQCSRLAFYKYVIMAKTTPGLEGNDLAAKAIDHQLRVVELKVQEKRLQDYLQTLSKMLMTRHQLAQRIEILEEAAGESVEESQPYAVHSASSGMVASSFPMSVHQKDDTVHYINNSGYNSTATNEAVENSQESYEDKLSQVSSDMIEVLRQAVEVQTLYENHLAVVESQQETENAEDIHVISPLGRRLLSVDKLEACTDGSDSCQDISAHLYVSADFPVDVHDKTVSSHSARELSRDHRATVLPAESEGTENKKSENTEINTRSDNAESYSIEGAEERAPFLEIITDDELIIDEDSNFEKEPDSEEDHDADTDYDNDGDEEGEFDYVDGEEINEFDDLNNLNKFLKSDITGLSKFGMLDKFMKKAQFSKFLRSDDSSDVITIALDEKHYLEMFLIVAYNFLRGFDKKLIEIDSNDRQVFLSVFEKYSSVEQSLHPMVHHLKYFSREAYSCFTQISAESSAQHTRREVARLLNTFVLSYHYGVELSKIITSRHDPTQLALTVLSRAELAALKPFNESVVNSLRMAKSSEQPVLLDDDYDDLVRLTSPLGDDEDHDNDDEDDYADNGTRDGLQKRRLLSVEDETCTKEDPDCTAASSSKIKTEKMLTSESIPYADRQEEKKTVGTTEAPSPIKKKHLDQRCQELVDGLARHMKVSHRLPDEKSMSTLTQLQQLNHIRKYTKRMVESQALMTRLKELNAELKTVSEIKRLHCQTLLKGTIPDLTKLQEEGERSYIMNHMNELAASTDPYIREEVKKILDSLGNH